MLGMSLFSTFRAHVLVFATGKVTGTFLIEFEAQAFDVRLTLGTRAAPWLSTGGRSTAHCLLKVPVAVVKEGRTWPCPN